MIDNLEVAEQVFKPGNLVFGQKFRRDEILPFLTEGIKTGQAVKKEVYSPQQICMALLSKRRLPQRYDSAMHMGPGGFLGEGNISVIISREKIQNAYPGKLYAIGDHFQQPPSSYISEELRDKYWEMTEENGERKVFGFPIKYESQRWNDEVRYYPDDPLTAAVPPDMWEGIVVPSHYLKYWPEWFEHLKIPVFSPKCELLYLPE